MDSFSAPGVESSAVHGTQHDKSSTPQGTDGIEAETTQGTGTEPGQLKGGNLHLKYGMSFIKNLLVGDGKLNARTVKNGLVQQAQVAPRI